MQPCVSGPCCCSCDCNLVLVVPVVVLVIEPCVSGPCCCSWHGFSEKALQLKSSLCALLECLIKIGFTRNSTALALEATVCVRQLLKVTQGVLLPMTYKMSHSDAIIRAGDCVDCHEATQMFRHSGHDDCWLVLNHLNRHACR